MRLQIEVGLGGVHPALLHAVAHRQRQRAVVVLWARDRRRAPDRIAQVIEHGLLEFPSLHAGAHVRDGSGRMGGAGGGDVGWVVRVIVATPCDMLTVCRPPARPPSASQFAAYKGHTQLVISSRSVPCSCA